MSTAKAAATPPPLPAACRPGKEPERAGAAGEVLHLLLQAHRQLATPANTGEGMSAASVAAIECAVHLVRAAERTRRHPAGHLQAAAEAADALGAARAAVAAATFAVRAAVDARRHQAGIDARRHEKEPR